MTRPERLLCLLQILRVHRYPVSGAHLAEELGISIRTLYRDIASLQAQGADIVGEAGVGYVLRPGFMLPPLMFSQEELEALMLGFRWVAKVADDPVTKAALGAKAKIAAVLPKDLQEELENSALLVGPRTAQDDEQINLEDLRSAIRNERRLKISYMDEAGNSSERTIWPLALGYFQEVRVLVAYCEQREDFRHFRSDRIVKMQEQAQRYPKRRSALLKQWRQIQKEQAPRRRQT
ncbi:helix-turn-helix transcriptional regulator [Flexibacterium corallicola]|uniref:helix-turn-helix transcriptional regulator n=1 Tax=Flexibacterium corallicola TaxID=3037259 RepID=UPI00286F6FF2|nr:YafY family protein [Pseudovibrio sp. M1P-2-3]